MADAVRCGAVSGQLIVMAAPRPEDPYYAAAAASLCRFIVTVAHALHPPDHALILCDGSQAAWFRAEAPAAQVVAAPQGDIWLRDFGPVTNGLRRMLFRYAPEGQGGDARRARRVQARLAKTLGALGDAAPRARLILDGGNFVSDGAGRAVASTKILRDNRIDAAAARAALRRHLGIEHLALIDMAEDRAAGDRLEHADARAAWLAPGVLLVQQVPDLTARDLDVLSAALPGVTLVPLPLTGRDVADADPRYPSALDLYANLVATETAVYLPRYGLPTDDPAQATVRAAVFRPVIPIDCGAVAAWGGSLRCLTCQVTMPSDPMRIRARGTSEPAG